MANQVTCGLYPMPSGVIGGNLGVVVGSNGVIDAADGSDTGFIDDFTRANGPIGAPWTSHAGTWSINGNRAAVTASNGTEVSTSVDVGSADMAVEWELTTLPSPGRLYFPVRVVDASNYLFFTNSVLDPNRIFCYHRTSGGNNQLGSFVTVSGWLANNTTIRVEAEGTTLRLYSDGNLIDTRTGITQHQTATRAGLAGFRDAGATIQNARWSRFHCAPL